MAATAEVRSKRGVMFAAVMLPAAVTGPPAPSPRSSTSTTAPAPAPGGPKAVALSPASAGRRGAGTPSSDVSKAASNPAGAKAATVSPNDKSPPRVRSRWDSPRFRWSVLGAAALILLSAVGASVFYAWAPSPGKQIAVYVTDAPSGFDRFDLRVAGVFVGTQGYPIALKAPHFNVLDYHGKERSLKIAEGSVPAGEYSQIAVVFASAKASTHGQTVDLAIPHKMLKVTSGFELSGRQSSVLLDLDVGKSVVTTPSGLAFHPFIRNVWSQASQPATEDSNAAMPDLSLNGFTDEPTTDPPQVIVDPPPTTSPTQTPEPEDTLPPPPPEPVKNDTSTDPDEDDDVLAPLPRPGTYDSTCIVNDQILAQFTPHDTMLAEAEKQACAARATIERAYADGGEQLVFLVEGVHVDEIPLVVSILDEADGTVAGLENGKVPSLLSSVKGMKAADVSSANMMPLDVPGLPIGPVTDDVDVGSLSSTAVAIRPALEAPASSSALSSPSVMSQAYISSFTAAAERYGVDVQYIFANEYAFIVSGTPAAMDAFAGDDFVESVVFAGGPGTYLSGPSRDQVMTQRTTAFASQFTGRNVGVAVIDSGIDGTHPALPVDLTGTRKPLPGKPLVVYENTLAAPLSGLSFGSVLPPMGSVVRLASSDGLGHGTEVAGILAGGPSDNGPSGFAPGAKLYGCGMGDVPTLALAAACLDQIVSLIDHPRAGDPTIRVLSMSFEFGSEDANFPGSPFYDELAHLIARGVTVVVASGTAPYDTSLMCAAPLPGILCVGAAQPAAYVASRSAVSLLPQSAVGRFSDGPGPWQGPWHNPYGEGDIFVDWRTTWPDVCAMGLDVVTTYPLMWGAIPYGPMSGTSAATPMVAATVALIQEARAMAGLNALKPWEIEQVIKVSAYSGAPLLGPYYPSTDSRYDGAGPLCGHGLLDIDAALALALTYP